MIAKWSCAKLLWLCKTSTLHSTDFQCKGSILDFVCHHRLYFSVFLLNCYMSHIESSITFSGKRQYSFKKFNIALKQKHSELREAWTKKIHFIYDQGALLYKNTQLLHGCFVTGPVIRSPAAYSHDALLQAVTTWDNHSIAQTFFTEKNNKSNNAIPFAIGESNRILNSRG